MSTPDNPQGTEPTVPLPPAAPPYGSPASAPYGSPAPASYGAPESAPYGSPPYGSAPHGAAPYGAPGYGAGAPYGAYGAPKTNVLAIVSLISALSALVIPVIGSVVAIITGHMGLSQIKQTGEQGRGLALAGTIIGYVGVGFILLTVVFFLALLPAIIGSATTYGTLS